MQWQVTPRIRWISKILLGFFAACMLAIVMAWGALLTGICENPRRPMPETQHVIPYNCHGMTVYISPVQEALKTWLMPLLLVFILLTLAAAALVLVVSAKINVDVRIERTRGAPD